MVLDWTTKSIKGINIWFRNIYFDKLPIVLHKNSTNISWGGFSIPNVRKFFFLLLLSRDSSIFFKNNKIVASLVWIMFLSSVLLQVISSYNCFKVLFSFSTFLLMVTIFSFFVLLCFEKTCSFTCFVANLQFLYSIFQVWRFYVHNKDIFEILIYLLTLITPTPNCYIL